jgi:UDP-2-acetamido-2-deoxy-ribo-hexuluronate aminotransferase
LPSTTDSPRDIAFVDLKAQYACLKPAIDARIAAVLEHGQFIMGPEVAEFEAVLAARGGCAHAVGVASGTDALLIALMAENIGPGDAVFVPAFTFPATAEVVAAVGAAPVFVEVEEASFNLDPRALAEQIERVRIEGRLQPRAIIAVDLYGRPADYPRLDALAREHGLFLLADAAQSFGARQGNRPVGSLAPVTATSFFPAKPLGCYGDGGALLTDDADRAALYRSIRAHGKGDGKYDIVRIGMNGRLDTLQAAILLAKLDVFAEELAAREKLARYYDRHLGEDMRKPERAADTVSAWAQYTIRVEGRDRIAKELAAAGVPTAVYYPRPLHHQPAFARFSDGPESFPISQSLCRSVLSLPMHPYMDDATAERVCSAVASATRGRAAS